MLPRLSQFISEGVSIFLYHTLLNIFLILKQISLSFYLYMLRLLYSLKIRSHSCTHTQKKKDISLSVCMLQIKLRSITIETYNNILVYLVS